MASIESNRDIVLLAEQTANHRSYTAGAQAVVGRAGIIKQLAEAIQTATPEQQGETEVEIYLMLVRMNGTGFEIVKDTILFNTEGDFEENLVKYGIK